MREEFGDTLPLYTYMYLCTSYHGLNMKQNKLILTLLGVLPIFSFEIID